MEPFDFDDLTPVETTVKYKKQLYYLTEASAGAAAAYSNAKMRSVKMDGTKVTGMDGAADADLVLLSHCLFKDGPQRTSVPVEELRRWLSRVTTPLVKWVKDHSDDLRDGDDTEESLAKEQELLDSRKKALAAGLTPGKGDSPGTPRTSG